MSFHFTWGGQPEGKLLSPEHSSLAQEDKCISVPEWENYTILSSLEENMYWVCTLCTLMMYIYSISIWIMLNLYLCNIFYVDHYDISLVSRNRRETRFQKIGGEQFPKIENQTAEFFGGCFHGRVIGSPTLEIALRGKSVTRLTGPVTRGPKRAHFC